MTEDPGHLIRAAIDRLVAASVRQRAAMAVTLRLMPTDLLALHHIGRRDDMTPGELGDTLLLSSGGTTAVIDRLTKAGLISRSPGSGSRRRVLLRITADGRAVTAAPLGPMTTDIATLTRALSPEEQTTVEGFLARVADVAERHADRLVSEGADASGSVTAGVPSPVLWG